MPMTETDAGTNAGVIAFPCDMPAPVSTRFHPCNKRPRFSAAVAVATTDTTLARIKSTAQVDNNCARLAIAVRIVMAIPWSDRRSLHEMGMSLLVSGTIIPKKEFMKAIGFLADARG
jgi:hypothetical protein